LTAGKGIFPSPAPAFVPHTCTLAFSVVFPYWETNGLPSSSSFSSPDFLDLYVSDLWGPRLLVVFAAAFWVVSHEQGGYPQGAGEFLLLHSICSANNLVFPLCVFADIFLHWPIMHRASVSSICLPPYMSVVAILWGFYFSRNSHVMF
jgi:hypothetical protein